MYWLAWKKYETSYLEPQREVGHLPQGESGSGRREARSVAEQKDRIVYIIEEKLVVEAICI